jgi:hypothetical protein
VAARPSTPRSVAVHGRLSGGDLKGQAVGAPGLGRALAERWPFVGINVTDMLAPPDGEAPIRQRPLSPARSRPDGKPEAVPAGLYRWPDGSGRR